MCVKLSTTHTHICYTYFNLVGTHNVVDHFWVSLQLAQGKLHFSCQCKSAYLKQYDVLKVKDTLLKSAYCVTEGGICSLVRIGLFCPWFRKESRILASNLLKGHNSLESGIFRDGQNIHSSDAVDLPSWEVRGIPQSLISVPFLVLSFGWRPPSYRLCPIRDFCPLTNASYSPVPGSKLGSESAWDCVFLSPS